MKYMKRIKLIIGFSVLLPLNVWGATITVEDISFINSFKQVVYFTFNFDGQDYEWSINTSILSGAELQNWLDTRMDYYQFSTLHTRYMRVPENIKNLLQIQQWIAAGAKINGKVMSRKAFKGKHPKSIQLKKGLNAATSLQERVTILENYILGD